MYCPLGLPWWRLRTVSISTLQLVAAVLHQELGDYQQGVWIVAALEAVRRYHHVQLRREHVTAGRGMDHRVGEHSAIAQEHPADRRVPVEHRALGAAGQEVFYPFVALEVVGQEERVVLEVQPVWVYQHWPAAGFGRAHGRCCSLLMKAIRLAGDGGGGGGVKRCSVMPTLPVCLASRRFPAWPGGLL